jgi:hypothetical protein
MASENKAGSVFAKSGIEILDRVAAFAENRPLHRKAERPQPPFDASKRAGLGRGDRRTADQLDEERSRAGGGLARGLRISFCALIRRSSCQN